MSYIHPYYPIFTYFDLVLDHPNWSSKKILDFGGNSGNILRDPNCKIKPENYTCVDVDQTPLQQGQKDFPRARWLHYNRYNSVYNPKGLLNEPLPLLSEKFDFILAFSVFTHTSTHEMKQTIAKDLWPLLTENGQLALTFLEPETLPYFVAKRSQSFPINNHQELIEKSKDHEMFYYLNHDIITLNFENEKKSTFHHMLAFYTKKNIKNVFESFNCEIRDPVGHEIQSCLILRK